MSMRRSIKLKLRRAKIALNTTLERILDINRNRKKEQSFQQLTEKRGELNDELKLLNKIADRQANIIKKYENFLEEARVGAS